MWLGCLCVFTSFPRSSWRVEGACASPSCLTENSLCPCTSVPGAINGPSVGTSSSTRLWATGTRPEAGNGSSAALQLRQGPGRGTGAGDPQPGSGSSPPTEAGTAGMMPGLFPAILQLKWLAFMQKSNYWFGRVLSLKSFQKHRPFI